MRHRPEYDRKLIGDNLRRLREAKNLSVEEVRRYLCMGSVQAIYKYEKGTSYPPVDTMFALMELYEADIDDIIREHGRDLQPAQDILKNLDVIFMDRVRKRQAGRWMEYYKLYSIADFQREFIRLT